MFVEVPLRLFIRTPLVLCKMYRVEMYFEREMIMYVKSKMSMFVNILFFKTVFSVFLFNFLFFFLYFCK